MASAAFLVVTALSGCGATGTTTPAPNPVPALPSGESTSSPAADDTSSAEPSGRASLPPDPAAPATVKPVSRPGEATKRIKGTSSDLDGVIRWKDGVSVRVTAIDHGVTNG